MSGFTPDTAYERQDWLADVGAAGVRRACGISQVTVARALGVSQAAVCHWETGRRAPLGPAGVAYCRVIAGLLRHLEPIQAETATEARAA